MDADAVRRLAGRLIAPVDQPRVVAAEDAGFERDFVGYVATPGAEQPVPQESVAAPVAVEPQTAFEDAVAADPPPVLPPVTPPASEEAWQTTPAEPVFFPVPESAVVTQMVPDVEEIETPRPFLAPAEAPVEVAAPVPVAHPPVAPVQPAGLEGKLVARLEFFRDWLVSKFDAKGAFILDRDGEPVLDDPPYVKLHFLARSLAQAYRPVKGEPGNVHVKIGSASYLAVIPVETAFGCLVLGAVLPEPIEASAVSLVAHALETASTPTRR